MSAQPWTHLYPPGVSADAPSLPEDHLARFVRAHAGLHASRPAFSTILPGGQCGTLSFSQINSLSEDFAVFLRETLGLKAGDRVALQLPNCLAYPIAAFGVFKAGLVLVNTNPLYTPAEMAHQFRDSGARALVILDLFADKVAAGTAGSAVEHVVTASLTEGFAPLSGAVLRFVLKHVQRRVPKCGVPHLPFDLALKLGARDRAQGADAAAYIAGQGSTTLACLQYTGGTTGVSKAAMLSHGNLLSNVEQVFHFAKHRIIPEQEIVLAPLPLYHVFAFTVNLLTFFRTGAHGVLVPSPRPPSNLKAAFRRFDITWMCGVNTLYAALLNEPWFREQPPRSLKVAIAGGAALLGAVAERWRVLLGSPPIEGYGLSEASPVVCFNPLDRGRPGCIGVPMPGTDVRLLREDGTEAEAGEHGELCVRGPQVMSGYWGRPEETAGVFRDGWLRTGDVGAMDPDGYFRIVDRLKDVIVVSGFKVFPTEVEDCLTKLVGVRQAAAVGAPHGDQGEQVVAFVVRAPGSDLNEAAVREHCRLSLTNYKVPRHVVFKDDLPKSNIGKVLRKDLREEAARAVQGLA